MRQKRMRRVLCGRSLMFAVVLLSAAGCGRVEQPPEVAPEIRAAIEARRVNYKEIGGAFKTITDEIKSGAPDLNTIGPMAREIRERAADQLKYFPVGSGIESGQKTRGKAEIWSNHEAFAAKHEKFIAAADGLTSAIQAGDMASIGALHSALGATCKGCHDRFRESD